MAPVDPEAVSISGSTLADSLPDTMPHRALSVMSGSTVQAQATPAPPRAPVRSPLATTPPQTGPTNRPGKLAKSILKWSCCGWTGVLLTLGGLAMVGLGGFSLHQAYVHWGVAGSYQRDLQATSLAMRSACRLDTEWAQQCAARVGDVCGDDDNFQVPSNGDQHVVWMVGDCGEWISLIHNEVHKSDSDSTTYWTFSMTDLLAYCPNYQQYLAFITSDAIRQCRDATKANNEIAEGWKLNGWLEIGLGIPAFLVGVPSWIGG